MCAHSSVPPPEYLHPQEQAQPDSQLQTAPAEVVQQLQELQAMYAETVKALGAAREEAQRWQQEAGSFPGRGYGVFG